MKKSIVPGCVFALLVITALCGCDKRSGEAVVIGKDSVAAVKQGEEIKDERATNHEQWIVKVRMLDNGRRVQVHVDQAQWEKLHENNRVKVTIARVNIPEPFGTPRFSETPSSCKLR